MKRKIIKMKLAKSRPIFIMCRIAADNNQINQQDLDKVIQLVRGFAKSDMGQLACVISCQAAVSSTGYGVILALLCPTACET